jgi:hypothetical protein
VREITYPALLLPFLFFSSRWLRLCARSAGGTLNDRPARRGRPQKNKTKGEDMNDVLSSKPTRGFWIISGVALVWNLLGVMAYLMHVSMTPETLAAMSPPERALYENAPSWVAGAYAIAVFGGTLGAVGLLLRKSWAIPLFIISLVGILAQMGYSLLIANTIEVMGMSVVIMPLVVILIGIYLLIFSRSAKRQGLIY